MMMCFEKHDYDVRSLQNHLHNAATATNYSTPDLENNVDADDFGSVSVSEKEEEVAMYAPQSSSSDADANASDQFLLTEKKPTTIPNNTTWSRKAQQKAQQQQQQKNHRQQQQSHGKNGSCGNDPGSSSSSHSALFKPVPNDIHPIYYQQQRRQSPPEDFNIAQTPKIKSEQIHCGKRVSCECIKAYLMHRACELSQFEINLLKVAMAEIETIKPRAVLSNCELKIITGKPNSHDPIFKSGNGANKFMVVGRNELCPQFIVRTCPLASIRKYLLSVQYMQWLNIIRVIGSAVAFLYVLFWIFDELHVEMPISGCLDVKAKLFTAMTPSSPYNRESYCGAPQVEQEQTELAGQSKSNPLIEATDSFFDLFKFK